MNKLRRPQTVTNLFALETPARLRIAYRTVEVDGVPAGDDQAEHLEKLRTQLGFALRCPVAITARGKHPRVAVPAATVISEADYQLTPFVAHVRPTEAVSTIELGKHSEGEAYLLRSFVEFALRSPLHANPMLWGKARRWYWKQPTDTGRGGQVVAYPGFAWHVVDVGGRLYVAIDPTTRYIASEPITGAEWDMEALRFRHCLYRYGDEWYEIQLMRVLESPISETRFAPRDGQTTDVFSYTTERWRSSPPPWIRQLDPASPGIVYRTGSRFDRFGALALCWLCNRTDDPDVGRLHRVAILEPEARLDASRVAAEVFNGAVLDGVPIGLSVDPMGVPSRHFRLPTLQFGGGTTLDPNTSLRDYPRARAKLLTDPRAGWLSTTPLGRQYLVLPKSLSRQVNEDFASRLQSAITRHSLGVQYAATLVLYDDTNARTLHQYVNVLKEALTRAGARGGYGIAVLPERAPRDLHHWVKAELYPELQLKCASASSIMRYYDRGGRLRSDRSGEYHGYITNCAIGVLLVNRRWPWAIASPLHHDVHIGIDVLNGQAGLTFAYCGGRDIHFEHRPGTLPERLSTPQLASALTEELSRRFPPLGANRPTSIVIHRDGRLFESEKVAVHRAIADLQRTGSLGLDVKTALIEIHKDTSQHLRLFSSGENGRIRGPRLGAWWARTATDGLVVTTGWPYRTPGTPKPLAVSLVEGDVELAHLLEDILCLSQLGFSMPSGSTRLPVTLKLSDDFLEAVAVSYDEEAARYDSELLDIGQAS